MSSRDSSDTWKLKQKSEEARYIHEKEQAQLKAIQAQMDKKEADNKATEAAPAKRDIEGGFGGQEDLEDRYATTSGEH